MRSLSIGYLVLGGALYAVVLFFRTEDILAGDVILLADHGMPPIARSREKGNSYRDAGQPNGSKSRTDRAQSCLPDGNFASIELLAPLGECVLFSA